MTSSSSPTDGDSKKTRWWQSHLRIASLVMAVTLLALNLAFLWRDRSLSFESTWPWIFNGIVFYCLIVDAMRQFEPEDRLASLRKMLVKNPDSPRVMLSLMSVGVIFGFLYLIWRPHLHTVWDYSDGGLMRVLPVFLVMAGTLMLAGLLLILLNPKTIADEDRLKAAKKLDEALDQITSDLTQANLVVAAMHIYVDNKPAKMDTMADELFLRKLDDELRVKESLVSVEKVILARKRDVDELTREFQAEQLRVRKALTSSVSGVGVGFLTYELGGAVKNFVLLTNQQHAVNFGFWLEAVVQHDSAPKGDGDNSSRSWQPADADVSSLAAMRRLSPEAREAGNPETATVYSQLEKHFQTHYHRAELMSESVLLTVTLLVSLMAAWVGWRKSADE